MSSSFRLCLHKIVAALSIHCHHGYSTASAIPRTTRHHTAQLPLVGVFDWQALCPMGEEVCDVIERTGRDMNPNAESLLLTHWLNKGGCHISSYLFKRNRFRANVRLWDVLTALPLLLLKEYNQLTPGSSQWRAFLCETWEKKTLSPPQTPTALYLMTKITLTKRSTQSKV